MKNRFDRALSELGTTFPSPDPKRREDFLNSLPQTQRKQSAVPLIHMNRRPIWYALPAAVAAAVMLTVGIHAYRNNPPHSIPSVPVETSETETTISTESETVTESTTENLTVAITENVTTTVQTALSVPAETSLPSLSPTNMTTANTTVRTSESHAAATDVLQTEPSRPAATTARTSAAQTSTRTSQKTAGGAGSPKTPTVTESPTKATTKSTTKPTIHTTATTKSTTKPTTHTTAATKSTTKATTHTTATTKSTTKATTHTTSATHTTAATRTTAYYANTTAYYAETTVYYTEATMYYTETTAYYATNTQYTTDILETVSPSTTVLTRPESPATKPADPIEQATSPMETKPTQEEPVQEDYPPYDETASPTLSPTENTTVEGETSASDSSPYIPTWLTPYYTKENHAPVWEDFSGQYPQSDSTPSEVLIGKVTMVYYTVIDGMPYTAIQVEPQDILKGSSKGGMLTVLEPGGYLPVKIACQLSTNADLRFRSLSETERSRISTVFERADSIPEPEVSQLYLFRLQSVSQDGCYRYAYSTERSRLLNMFDGWYTYTGIPVSNDELLQ
ncbi:MAG: hypothetical protein K6F80_06500 [Oscillospiraceae bacterium]|nr:hypothetical protein [Oscillospiraceae bacterium]